MQGIVDLPCNEKLQQKLIVTVLLLLIFGTSQKKIERKKLSQYMLTKTLVGLITSEPELQ